MRAKSENLKFAIGIIAFGVTGLNASALAQNIGARITDGSAVFDYTADGTGALPTIISATGPSGKGDVPTAHVPPLPARELGQQLAYYQAHGRGLLDDHIAAEIEDAPASPVTATGTRRSTVVPSPSSPLTLEPKLHTAPFGRSTSD